MPPTAARDAALLFSKREEDPKEDDGEEEKKGFDLEAAPFVSATLTLIGGEVRDIGTGGDDVPGVRVEDVTSPMRFQKEDGGGGASGSDGDGDDNDIAPVVIGRYAFCTKEMALEAVQAADNAYDKGRGEWPRATPRERIRCVEKFAGLLEAQRDVLAQVIVWEIAKTKADAYKEVDRTVQYIRDTVADLKRLENESTHVLNSGGVVAQIKRSPLGVALCAAPFNYPLNETYTTLIPAIIMGNTVVLKTPRIGGLVHVPTLEMFRTCFPPGVVNVVHGSGRTVFQPIMESGLVQALCFIGTNKAANALHSAHPRPFTVRLALGLDAKNPAIVLPDARTDLAAKEIALGALSYNGQRCTAIKVVFVHESIADEFVQKLADEVDALRMGFPWQDGVSLTPLPEPSKPQYLRDLIEDCEAKGAKIVNKVGGRFVNESFCYPTVMYPVDLSMRAAHEEQFGPLIPVIPYKESSELEEYMCSETEFGQQAAIFTSSEKDLPPLIDFLAHHVCRININSQCQRGPDFMPFSGRKCSATGTLSVHDALRALSIRVAVATKPTDDNIAIVQNVLRDGKSNVLRADLLI